MGGTVGSSLRKPDRAMLLPAQALTSILRPDSARQTELCTMASLWIPQEAQYPRETLESVEWYVEDTTVRLQVAE